MSERVTISVAVAPQDDGGYLATAITTTLGSPAAVSHKTALDPYDAVCAAILAVMTETGR